jgi:ATP-dependent Lon protease
MLPARNRKDLEDVPEAARRQVNFVWLDDVDDAVVAALSERDDKGKAVPRLEQGGDRHVAQPA